MTIQVDIINPKAAKLLKDLADMNLIVLREMPKDKLASTVKSIRKKAEKKPISMEDITKEVEKARTKRYAKQTKKGHTRH
jgi:hypothetical protein